MDVEFDLKELPKYTTECPMCAPVRKKRKTKTLTVYRDPPNQKGECWLSYECSHWGQCEWNTRQSLLEQRTEALGYTMDTDAPKPIKPLCELPSYSKDGSPYWWYKNDRGEVVFGVHRDTDKKYYPVTVDAEGNISNLRSWPDVKMFYKSSVVESDKVLIVEGEKAADAAQQLFPNSQVLTWRGGSGNINTANWRELRGKTVYLWPDNDDPGRKCMGGIAGKLEDCHVYMVDTSGFPEKSDLADNLPFPDVQKALKLSVLVRTPDDMFSTLDTIADSALIRGSRFMTGWEIIDEKVKLPMSGMVVVEGRTGHGKTATAINLAYNTLKQGAQVFYFSFEIPEDEVVARLIRIEHSHMDLEDIIVDLSSKVYPEYTKEIVSKVSSGLLKITDPRKRITAQKLKDMLNSDRYKDSLVIIDHAQKVPTSKIDIRHGLVDLMDQIELVAKEHGFLVMMLCQLTPIYSDPLLDSPAESKSVHYNADMVLRVWKKSVKWAHVIYDTVPGNYVIDLIKNRNGESDQLLGFEFINGARLEPNDSDTQVQDIRRGETRATLAMERIANSLDAFINKETL